MQSIKILLCAVALATVCGAYARQTVPSTTPIAPSTLTTEQWEKRVKASADDPRQARKVVLDAIYANQTALVARDYEGLYNLKPSDVRLGTFGYAAAVSERFRSNDEPTYKPTFHHAAILLQHACASEEEMSAAQAASANLTYTKEANAWLAWGDIRLRMGFDVKGAEKAYWQAIKLDPNNAEAYWWLADLAVEPYDEAYFKAHVDQARKSLNYAEKLEPKLHPFCVDDRSYFYFATAPTPSNIRQGLSLSKEFLRLWPENPHADTLRQVIITTEKRLSRSSLH